MSPLLRDLNRTSFAITVMFAGVAWLSFAEHPTAAKLRRAIAETLPLA